MTHEELKQKLVEAAARRDECIQQAYESARRAGQQYRDYARPLLEPLRQRGMSDAEIARIIGITPPTVARILGKRSRETSK